MSKWFQFLLPQSRRARLSSLATASILIASVPADLAAQSVQAPTSDPAVEAQLASFQIHDEFEVQLFADESHGIANPIAIHWDRKGRLWVLTTLAYAQLAPGEKPDDKLFILEDTDGDGRADTRTLFADGLAMPTGFALGHGGVYVGEGPDLIFLRDSDRDDRADSREVLLSGFGHGDTHQNISNLTWGPDGRLYFTQGLHTFTRVETPWGIVRGDTAGFWRFHPGTQKLEPFGFPSLVSQNPCGVAFDPKGNLFIKSNNRELIFSTPALVPTTNPMNLVPIASVGATPGKSMGGEFVQSAHLPDWLQGHILIAGYYSHRVTAFPLVPDGSGFARVDPVELLFSDHESFRPVDIRIGPDGAIYIADWFNPIIGHYQASLRHPDRDRSHGRIWRMTAKGRDPIEHLPLPVSWIPEGAPLPSEIDSAPPREFSELSPNERLQAVVAWSNRDEVDALKIALQALDHGPDRFIDYALRQAVHAQADRWMPDLQKGTLSFDSPAHLAFALGTLGGPESAAIAREQLWGGDLDPSLEPQFASVLARVGSSEDLKQLLDRPQEDAALLLALVDAHSLHQKRPAAPYLPRLRELINAPTPEEVRAAAITLAGLWKSAEFSPRFEEIAQNDNESLPVRVEALRSWARLTPGAAKAALLQFARSQDSPAKLRLTAFELLCRIDLEQAASLAADQLADDQTSESPRQLLASFLNRKGGSAALATALATAELSSDRAVALGTALAEMGRSDSDLIAVLNRTLGIEGIALPYSPDYVAQLADEVRKSGDPEKGGEIYRRAQLTCVACHQIGGVGGILGPNLDTVGAGLPLDLVIESVLWPNRQLKEGYFAISVTTRDGEVLTGYEEKEAEGLLWMRDTASGKTRPISPRQIVQRTNIGTLMPAGLTRSLSREELRDLVAYLASLKGSAPAR